MDSIAGRCVTIGTQFHWRRFPLTMPNPAAVCHLHKSRGYNFQGRWQQFNIAPYRTDYDTHGSQRSLCRAQPSECCAGPYTWFLQCSHSCLHDAPTNSIHRSLRSAHQSQFRNITIPPVVPQRTGPALRFQQEPFPARPVPRHRQHQSLHL